MKKIFLGITMLMLLLTSMVTVTEARLAANSRRAVVLELFYALRPSYDGGCDKTIPAGTNGKCVSNWDYLARDTYAYSVVKGWYTHFSSEWATPGDGSNYTGVYHYASFYNNVGLYAYGTFGGYYGPVGRGGECKYFANLILYRSGVHQTRFPSTPDMWNNATGDFSNVKEGDVLVTYANQSHADFDHITTVVEIKRSNGAITGLDVIDANWVSDTGVTFREVIGRHLFQISYARQFYRIWKGTPYYYCGYDPNGSNPNPNPAQNPLCK